jgi:hypothetical protein
MLIGSAHDDVRLAAEKIIIGLQLASAPSAHAILRDELREHWRRFEPLHAWLQDEIAADHARGRLIRTVEIAERVRPRIADARFNIRAYLQTLAASWSSEEDAARQMRVAIAAWRQAMGIATPVSSPAIPPTQNPRDERKGPEQPAARRRETQDAREADGFAQLAQIVASLDAFQAPRRLRPKPPSRRIVLRTASNVTPRAVRWLWDGWLAQGKLHLLAGHAGTGKTTLALSLAATLSRGGVFPDGSRAPVGATILWSGEDDLADSLLPRYLACGGDPKLLLDCSFAENGDGLRHGFDPATDFPSLVEVAAKFGNVKLVIVDPIVSAAGAGISNAQTRKALRPLVDFAEATGAAILGITHFAKRTAGRDAAERVIGSGAFHAMARAVWTTAMPANADAHFRLVRAKSNIGPARDGFEYRIERGEIAIGGGRLAAQRIAWGEPVFGNPRALLAEIERPEALRESALASAKTWLAERLKEGAVPAATVHRDAEREGISPRTLHRAKRDLSIDSRKHEDNWLWTINVANESAESALGNLANAKRRLENSC